MDISLNQNTNENLDSTKQFLTGKQVQFLFQVSRETLRRYREVGLLNPVRITPKKLLYRKTEIDKLLS